MQQIQTRRRMAAAGFTLVELMVVIAIIATLAAIVGVNVMGRIEESNVAAAQAQIKNFETAIVAYKIKFKKLPASLDDLASPGKGEPILSSIPPDPWGNPYVYTPEGGTKYKIVSHGADGSPGGADEGADISSDAIGKER